ncbi:MAG: DUF2207 domain-containing protein [Candidatus Nomurabacteria bacterium]|jgi:uncharacterized membrane protein YgcG|nr:DUF2207 domain-containing protein [Candidatus Nomurabacteria bacterium]
MKKPAVVLVALSAGVLAILATGIALASVQEFYFSSFAADYYLSKDAEGVSQMHVEERLTAEFPDYDQNKGIVRVVPRTNQGGKNRVLNNTHISVDRNGRPEPVYEKTSDSENYYIATGTEDYLHGTQRYGFGYQFDRVITGFDGYQELYWDTNGTGWKQRFDSLVAKVHLGGLASSFTGDAKCFVGSYGSKGESDCSYQTNGDMVVFTTKRMLQPGENLTFVLKFKPSSFTVPKPETSYLAFIVSICAVVISLTLLVLAFVIHRRRVAIPKAQNKAFIVPEYLPPKGISLLGAAQVYSKTGSSSMAAQIIDLAVNGKVRIIESEGGLVFKKKSYHIEVLETDGLLPDEKGLLGALSDIFTVGTKIDISKRSESRSQKLLSFSKKIYKNLASDGFVKKDKSHALKVLALLNVVLLSATIIGIEGFIGDVTVGMTRFMPQATTVAIVIVVLAQLVLIVLASQEPRYANLLTPGYKMRNYLRGLEQYIKLVEADRIKFLQEPDSAEKININDKDAMVKLYERLLPYAMIFGQEKKWAKSLEIYYSENHAPLWYSSNSAFSTAVFASSISSFSSSMSSTYGGGAGSLSSSGSGFSGGSSGGGGGGGGGGGR